MNKNTSLQRQEADLSRAAAGPAGPAQVDHPVQNSPVQRARRQRMQEAFGPAAQLQEPEPNRTGMPDSLKAGVESMSGMDMSDVRVHRNSPEPRQINALAYAQGNDIHLGPGQEKHMPHEAWHLVQQRQGRVQATTDVGGTPVNDDAGLEREADVMGQRAASMAPPQAVAAPMEHAQKTGGAVQRHSRPGSPVAQAIISVGDFKDATYGFGKSRHAIGPVDVALATYIGARTVGNANALYNAAHTYLTTGGAHAANRVAAVTALRQRVDDERLVLAQIGAGNVHLLDGLVDLATHANVPALVQLATDVTAAHAPALPGIIQAIGGAANINTLNVLQLVPHMTAAHAGLLPRLLALAGGWAQRAVLDALVQAAGAAAVPLLEPMITQSGGAGQIAALTVIINRHAGQGQRAFDLTAAAGGNAVEFARLAGEVPAFLRAGAPGAVPAGVTAAVNAYNLAMVPALTNALTALSAQAVIAHAQGTLAGVNVGLLGNVQNRINQVNARVLALGIPGAAIAPGDTVLVNNLNNIVTNALNGAMAGLGPLPAAFAAAVGGVTAARARALAAVNALPIQIGPNEFDHFLTRHTPHFFDFNEIKPDNTQWDPAWGAGAVAQVAAQLIGVLNALAAAGNFLVPGVALPNQAVPGGGTAQIAGRAGGVGVIVGQFFPEHNPGNNMYDHPDTTMIAIRRVL